MCFKKCFTKLTQPNSIHKIPSKLQRETELPNLQSYCALKCKLHLFDLLLICCACCLLTTAYIFVPNAIEPKRNELAS